MTQAAKFSDQYIPETATIVEDERLEMPVAFGDMVDMCSYLLEMDWTDQEIRDFNASRQKTRQVQLVGRAPTGRLIYAESEPGYALYSLGDFENGVSVSVSFIGRDIAAL